MARVFGVGLELLGVLLQVDAKAVEARRARVVIDEKYIVDVQSCCSNYVCGVAQKFPKVWRSEGLAEFCSNVGLQYKERLWLTRK